MAAKVDVTFGGCDGDRSCWNAVAGAGTSLFWLLSFTEFWLFMAYTNTIGYEKDWLRTIGVGIGV